MVFSSFITKGWLNDVFLSRDTITTLFVVLIICVILVTYLFFHQRKLIRLQRKHEDLERILEHERNLFRTIIDNLPDAIYAKDTACRKILANKTDVKNLGASTEAEVLGKDDFTFFTYDEALKFYEDDRYVIERGIPVINREESFTDKEGKQRWLLTSKIPFRDENGKIIGLIGIGRDITEYKRVQESLERERNLLRTLMDNLPDLIYFKDAQGRYLLNNKAPLHSLGME
ncbi:MAG: PAS domain-containing protein, partial [Bacteroidetes bacterium]|nr:PAS domain-containing protein [Bacteroidota bacterium]